MVRIKVKSSVLSEIRIRQGLSYRELANKSRVKYPTLNKIEKGLTSPTPKNAKLIVDALGVKFDDVFEIVNVERRDR